MTMEGSRLEICRNNSLDKTMGEHILNRGSALQGDYKSTRRNFMKTAATAVMGAKCGVNIARQFYRQP